jgi:hypothetical protein
MLIGYAPKRQDHAPCRKTLSAMDFEAAKRSYRARNQFVTLIAVTVIAPLTLSPA